MKTRLAVLLLVAACSSKKPSGAGNGSSTEVAAKDPCSPQELGLAGATELERWEPSNSCSIERPPIPKVLNDLDEVGAALDCSRIGGGGPKLEFDGPVVVTSASFSPAQTDFRAFDDGTTVTFVSVLRTPCPGDPRPMPSPIQAFGFGPLASGGSRAFADRACTMPAQCP